MITASILLSVLALPVADGADEQKTLHVVRVSCVSAESEAGYKDERLKAFCNRLGKIGSSKKSLIVATDGEHDVVVRYLGVGRFTKRGETTYVSGGYAWTPDESANRAGAVLEVPGLVKTFESEGTGFRPVGVVAKQIEEWIRENRETILEKAAKK